MSNVTHGEMSPTPRRGLVRVSGGTWGCGWRIWERMARARFAPAESPARMIWDIVSSVFLLVGVVTIYI